MIWYLLGGVTVLYFSVVVVYAISRGRDVKASLKVPCAMFSFETKQTRRADAGAVKQR